MNTITLATGSVDSYVSQSTAAHHDEPPISPLIIGVCAAGAGILLIVIMTVLCLFAQRRQDRHSKLKLKLASSSTTSSSSCNNISDIERQPISQSRRLRNGKTISQPFDPRKGEMLIQSMPPAAFFDTGSRVTSFISTPPHALVQAPASQSSLSPSSTTRRQSSRRHRIQPPIASATTVGAPVATAITPQLLKHQPSRAATVSSFVPSFVSPTTTTHTGADWQTAAPSSDLNHTPSFYVQSPTSSDSIPIRLDLVHTSSMSMVGIGRSNGSSTSVTLHATHADSGGQSIPSSPVTARRPEEKITDLVAALERNEAVSVVKRPVPTF